MLKKLCVLCLVCPLMLNASTNIVSMSDNVSYVSQNIESLKTDVLNVKVFNPQEIYNFLLSRISNNQSDENKITNPEIREVYYALMSFLREQTVAISEKDLKNKITSFMNALNWLYTGKKQDLLSEKVTCLGKLLDIEFFVHLNYDGMQKCIDTAHQLKDVIAYDSIRNEVGPEDGSDYYNGDFFMNDKVVLAETFFNKAKEWKNTASKFSANRKSLNKEQLISRVKKANDFINELKFLKCKVGDKEIKIPRNLRKYLHNLASIEIEKIIVDLNKLREFD